MLEIQELVNGECVAMIRSVIPKLCVAIYFVKIFLFKLSNFLNLIKENWLVCRENSDFGLVCRDLKSLGNTGLNKPFFSKGAERERSGG